MAPFFWATLYVVEWFFIFLFFSVVVSFFVVKAFLR